MRWPWQRGEERAATTQRDLRIVEAFRADRHFGQIVNAVTVEFLAAASASIDAISATLAALPAFVYRVTENGREEDAGHPLAELIAGGPNAHQTWPDFLQWLVAETLKHGNAVAELLRDDAGRLSGIRPLPADRRTIRLLPSGRLAYDVSDLATGRRRLLDDEVLHLRDRSDDGLIGVPRHHRAGPAVAAALALEQHSGAVFANSSFPGAAIELTGAIGEAELTRLRAQFEDLFRGPARSGRVFILPGGKFTPITATPVDQEILAARRFAGEEAARLYGVPPPIVGDLTHGSFANVADLLRFWAMGPISQWARRIEAEIARSALGATGRRTHALMLDVSGLLRGDPAQRWAAWKIAAETGVLTPNEIRGEEGWNPRPGGDDVRPAAGVGEQP